MAIIELPDEEAAALKARAAAEGLTLEGWLEQLARSGRSATLDWSECPAVESVPGKMSGAWVLKGTRMPVSAIFENLEAGASLDNIMEWFDGLDRQQVEAVIDFAARSLDRAPARRALMRVLFDQGVPAPIRRYLKDHTVRTAAEQGWFTNGDLLTAAEAAGFDVSVTKDRNLPFQQSLTGLRLASLSSANSNGRICVPMSGSSSALSILLRLAHACR